MAHFDKNYFFISLAWIGVVRASTEKHQPEFCVFWSLEGENCRVMLLKVLSFPRTALKSLARSEWTTAPLLCLD